VADAALIATEWNATSAVADEPPLGYVVVSVVVSAVPSARTNATSLVDDPESVIAEPFAMR